MHVTHVGREEREWMTMSKMEKSVCVSLLSVDSSDIPVAVLVPGGLVGIKKSSELRAVKSSLVLFKRRRERGYPYYYAKQRHTCFSVLPVLYYVTSEYFGICEFKLLSSEKKMTSVSSGGYEWMSEWDGDDHHDSSIMRKREEEGKPQSGNALPPSLSHTHSSSQTHFSFSDFC